MTDLLQTLQKRCRQARVESAETSVTVRDMDLINSPADELHDAMQANSNAWHLHKVLISLIRAHEKGSLSEDLRQIRMLRHYFTEGADPLPLDARLEANIIVLQRKLDENADHFPGQVAAIQALSDPFAAVRAIQDRRAQQYALKELTRLVPERLVSH
jgi:hypothetical protein